MVIVWGQRMYGRVDKFAGSHLATRFFHIYYLPLIPLSSWLVLEEHGEGHFTGIEVKMQLRSVLAAWLRVFAPIGFLASVFMLFDSFGPTSGGPPFIPVAQTLLACVLAGYAWFKLGKLSATERAARVAYAEHTGRYVDVALLAEQAAGIKQRAIEELDRHVGRHATAGYREAPQTGWREIATRPDMRDVPLLKAALVRARIETIEATGPARREMERAHQTILDNLIAASPELRQPRPNHNNTPVA
jgi:hypothetical protein